MKSYRMKTIEGRGYAGFDAVFDLPVGQGSREASVRIPLEVVLDLAATWLYCQTASEGHVQWHRDHPGRPRCSIENVLEEDRREVERLLARFRRIEGEGTAGTCGTASPGEGSGR